MLAGTEGVMVEKRRFPRMGKPHEHISLILLRVRKGQDQHRLEPIIFFVKRFLLTFVSRSYNKLSGHCRFVRPGSTQSKTTLPWLADKTSHTRRQVQQLIGYDKYTKRQSDRVMSLDHLAVIGIIQNSLTCCTPSCPN